MSSLCDFTNSHYRVTVIITDYPLVHSTEFSQMHFSDNSGGDNDTLGPLPTMGNGPGWSSSDDQISLPPYDTSHQQQQFYPPYSQSPGTIDSNRLLYYYTELYQCLFVCVYMCSVCMCIIGAKPLSGRKSCVLGTYVIP